MTGRNLITPFKVLVTWMYKHRERVARDTLVVLVSTCFVLAFFMVWVEDIYFRGGYTYEQLNENIQALQKENMILKRNIATESALITIEQKAKKLGFRGEKVVWMK